MPFVPAIKTERLALRPLGAADAVRLSALAGDYDVASMTGTVPHPYSESQAAEWIASVKAGEEGVVFGIFRDDELIGCTGYRAFGDDHAELGYWIGKPYWGQGYATEAVGALIGYAFDANGFDYLKAGHFTDNPASERVIRKLGFVAQGGEVRDCAARGTKTQCVTYRLDRAEVQAALRG
ncbi:MAG: GNAT family N-acetyltransferase [Methyloceanibacter sp.]|uniref:GNAT family N-acetyltransferase n=1 Tax=Methyloceanibacter sp. TaxID=1965321 RepID=UPI003D6CCDD3